MRKVFAAAAAAVTMVCGCTAAEPAGKKAIFSSTIDFLDYAFYDYKGGNKEYYPLEVYEERIRDMAAGGLKKIYLRVNVCGLTLYPTRVSAIYGTDDAFHWTEEERSFRLINTLAKYDPAAETIRLGHKYGLEVWCWESLCDESAYQVPAPVKYREAAKKLDFMPLLDPYYRKHPECQAMRNPALLVDGKKRDEINAAARKYPVAKIVLADTVRMSPPVKIKAEELMIYTSSDNVTFKRYEKPFKFTADRNEAGFNRITIEGLSITDPYIKLYHKPYTDKRWSIAVRQARGQGEVYNTRGEKIPTVWATIHRAGTDEQAALNFRRFDSAAFDYQHYHAGFIVGEPAEDNRFYYGIAEFTEPLAMRHRLDKFAELAKYDFDGFMFNIRTHSQVSDPENYGYNPAVIAKFRERFGRKPGVSDADRTEVFKIRAESIADFFKGCKALTGGRPIYLSGLKNDPENWRSGTRDAATTGGYQKKFGPLPWLYERYFADKSIDGVIMIGGDFRNELLPVIGDRPIKLGVFREMGFPPKGYDFVSDFAAIKADRQLDEAELYETMILSFKDQYYREILKPTE